MAALVWTLRDDKPQEPCDCAGWPLRRDEHSPWCASLKPHGAYYYVGRDLQGYWFMPGLENALRATYPAARRLRKELRECGATPRPLALERIGAANSHSGAEQ